MKKNEFDLLEGMLNSGNSESLAGLSRTTYSDPNTPKATSSVMLFKHINSLQWPLSKKTIHTCLEYDNWCWSNAVTNPLMAFHFLSGKLKNYINRKSKKPKSPRLR